MTEPIEIRSGGHLLFVLTPQGQVECLRDGWLHTIDVIATMTAGTPCVTRRYVGKSILTRIDISDRVASDS